MREIKFRGKSKESNSFVYGYLVHNDIVNEKYIVTKGHILVPIYENTITQFTGRKDKNGIEIYEGDIMKDRFGATCKIVYVNHFGSYKQLSKIGYTPLNQAAILSDNDIVIGNVYENPELSKT